MKLKGKNALITGGSRGLGREIARTFVQEGASVFICARHMTPLMETVDFLRLTAHPEYDGCISWASGDVGLYATEIFQTAVKDLGDIHILVNNAGIHGIIDNLENVEFYEWTHAFSVNFYAAAIMMRQALPIMKKQRYGKIINISGGGATKPMYGLSAYAASKAALVRLTENVALEQIDNHIDVNAVAPGALNTRLLDEVLAAGPDKIGAEEYQRRLQQQASGGDNIQEAANLCLFLASPDSDGITGRLISARWDNWRALNAVWLASRPDLYTLRRKDTQ